MQVAVVGRTYLLHANRAKWHYMPPGVALTLITPRRVQHTLQAYRVEPSQHWPHVIVPAWMTDRLSGFAFSPFALRRALQRCRADLAHVDEEPPSLALLEVLLLKRMLHYRVIFFTWENVVAKYRTPFRLLRRLAFSWADGAIAGSSGAASLLSGTGFRKPVAVIPQLGVDPDHFFARRADATRQALGLNGFVVGYVGRLVPEKGVLLLLEALAGLHGKWQWLIVGHGPLGTELESRARQLGVSERLRWVNTVPHQAIPQYLSAMDVLVLPSQTTSRWKEQFGHVLVEAMSCEVPVIGSDSGAIPEVIGEAGLIFPEGRADILTECLRRVRDDATLRQTLAQMGRQRVLNNYTDRHIAERTAAFWREVCPCA